MSNSLPAPPSFQSTIIQIKPKDQQTLNNDSNQKKRKHQPDNATAAKNDHLKKKNEIKTAHSIIEKKRRIKLNREFDILKILVPACRNSLISPNNTNNTNLNAKNIQINDGMYKLSILQATVEYIDYLHNIIRLLSNEDSNSDLSFSKLKVNMENYRDLDNEFNFIEIMKIFKLMEDYNKRTFKKKSIIKLDEVITDEEDNDYHFEKGLLNIPDGFFEFVKTKGIKTVDIESFQKFFETENLKRQKSKTQESIFNIINNKKLTSQNGSITFDNNSPEFFQTKHFINNNNNKNDFQLPAPIMDIPKFNNNFNPLGNNKKFSFSYSPLSISADSDTAPTSSGSNQLHKKISNDQNNEFFSLSPTSFSSLLKTPNLINNSEIIVNEKQEAGEALLQMKRVSEKSPLFKSFNNNDLKRSNSSSEAERKSLLKVNNILN